MSHGVLPRQKQSWCCAPGPVLNQVWRLTGQSRLSSTTAEAGQYWHCEVMQLEPGVSRSDWQKTRRKGRRTQTAECRELCPPSRKGHWPSAGGFRGDGCLSVSDGLEDRIWVCVCVPPVPPPPCSGIKADTPTESNKLLCWDLVGSLNNRDNLSLVEVKDVSRKPLD